MEKFSQFRDRGSGISPFTPITTPASKFAAALHAFLFLFRLPILIGYATVYFGLLHRLPLPPAVRKLLLWALMAIPGIWWVDLQLDGVKRGALARQPPSRVPHPSSVIAAGLTSPIDALYLAAVFDPIFVESFPGTRKVRRIGLLRAVMLALAPPPPNGHKSGKAAAAMPGSNNEPLTDLRALLSSHPDRVIAVFPEGGATNGRGILPFTPSLAAVPSEAPIFPVSIRYTPPDITTPVPGAWFAFLWRLLSRPTHCIRVRIAEGMHNVAGKAGGVEEIKEWAEDEGEVGEVEEPVTPEEQRFLNHIADTLARLGRNKRVGLTLRDKAAFVETWGKRRRS